MVEPQFVHIIRILQHIQAKANVKLWLSDIEH